MRKQTGFTIIELVIVIAILAILAATALPRFVDLSAEAEAAALAGVVGNIESASAINYAAEVAGVEADSYETSGAACSDVMDNILVGGLPDGYTITGSVAAVSAGPPAIAEGDVDTNCELTQTSTSTAVNLNIIIVD